MDVYLNLGSNKGDSAALLERAVALILAEFSPVRHRVSPPFRSKPWGFSSENDFVNIGMGIRLAEDMEPLIILKRLQHIEGLLNRSAHRKADGSYADRELDIDIIEIPGVEMATPELTLPHPRARQRDFVMIPLEQSLLLK